MNETEYTARVVRHQRLSARFYEQARRMLELGYIPEAIEAQQFAAEYSATVRHMVTLCR